MPTIFHRMSVLVVLLTILQYACDTRSEHPLVRDAATETSVYTNIGPGPDGVESPNPASNAGAVGSPSSRVDGSGDNSTTSASVDAATSETTSEDGEARGVADSGDALQSEAGSAPNSSECPTVQPQLDIACDIDSQVVCRYGATSCVCESLRWLCSTSQTEIDAAVAMDAQVKTDAEDGEEEEGEGPKWGPKSDGGTRGRREGGERGGSHDASADH
jgi:hypothetical protein